MFGYGASWRSCKFGKQICRLVSGEADILEVEYYMKELTSTIILLRGQGLSRIVVGKDMMTGWGSPSTFCCLLAHPSQPGT